MKRTLLAAAAIALSLAACTGPDQPGTAATPGPAPSPGAATSATTPPGAPRTPTLAVSVVVRGLEIPWDLAFLPDGSMLYTERDRERLTLRDPAGESRVVLDRPPGMWHGDETGLEAVILAGDFARSHDFITCHGFQDAGRQDVRVVRWHLGAGRATFVRNLVTGLPSTTGRHAGCALEHGSDGSLYVGTGDAAVGRNAQDLDSGGGKVLRISDRTGQALPDNPFAGRGGAMRQRIWSYGHRNVQGLALNPADHTVWSIEQGSYRDDEVNRSVRGGNFGWNPVPGYNEAVPMTDHSLPGRQIDAAWSSGNPTLATSGGTFLRGAHWGAWDGGLAVASLKNQSLHILRFDAAGRFVRGVDVRALRGTYGRLRAAVQGPDGALYVTTSNGVDDRIVRITPTVR